MSGWSRQVRMGPEVRGEAWGLRSSGAAEPYAAPPLGTIIQTMNTFGFSWLRATSKVITSSSLHDVSRQLFQNRWYSFLGGLRRLVRVRAAENA